MLHRVHGMRNLDEKAYDIVCNWYKATGFNPVYNGIDYSLIIRFYLWDKVGRALRLYHDNTSKETITYKKDLFRYSFYHTPIVSNGKFKKSFWNKSKIIYSPFIVPDYLENGFKVNRKFKLLTNTNNYLSKKRQIRSPKIQEDYWYKDLTKALLKSLEELEVHLISEDILLLEKQILGTFKITLLALTELEKYRPHGVFVYSDNHPPFINYVLAAKKLGIPTFTYQHGLDCEHYYLDDCFADFVAVWSENRKNRYVKDSLFQPKKYEIVGSVKHVSRSNRIDEDKNINATDDTKTLLFITRPHHPIKCYSPSRSFLEGTEILKVILQFMELNKDVNLIVKPHPSDLVFNYKDLVNDFGEHDRVTFSKASLSSLIKKARVVITEDSTAGVETMGFNRIVIHTHFANTRPVLPLVQRKCALSGYNIEDLRKSLEKCFYLDDEEIKTMSKNQDCFYSEYIPEFSKEKLINFVEQNIL